MTHISVTLQDHEITMQLCALNSAVLFGLRQVTLTFRVARKHWLPSVPTCLWCVARMLADARRS